MANQDVRVSALNSTSTLSTDDLSLETVVDELSETGYTSKKITEGAKASQYLENFTYSNLQTTAKTIVGAINEAAQSGGGRLDIEYDSTEEIFNVTSDEIVEALENGFMLTFSSDETADGFLYTLNSVHADNDELNLFFTRFWCMGNGSSNPNNGDLFQCIVTVDSANDTVTFGGYSEVANVLSTNDNLTGQYNNWSASQIDTAIKQAVWNVLPTRSASGSIASFTDGADNVPIVDGVFNIVAQQSGSGDPSPSNPRPITGFTGMNFYTRGANLWDEQWELGSLSTVDGSKSASDSTIRTKNNIYVKSNTKFSIVKGTGFPFYILFYDTNGVAIQYVQQTGDVAAYNKSAVIDANATSATFTTPSGTAYILIRFNSMTSYSGGISVNYPSTDTTYHSYNSNSSSIAIDWTTEAGTIYGGELDVTSGVLRVTFARVDLGTIDWRVLNTTNKFLCTQNQSLVPLAKPFSNNIRASAKCEIYPTLSRSEIKYSAPFETGLAIDQNGEMLISDQNSTWSTIQEAQAELSGHYVVYELATPVEIALTPEQINTLYGVNNIWADTGDVTVEYRADVQKYIDKKITEAVGGNRSLSLSKSAPEEVKEEESEEKEEKTEEGGNNER